MDETSKKDESMSEILPGIKITDPRPTDLQVFFQILPHILGGWATKSDIRGANSSGFIQAREALGQLAMMGVIKAGFVCNDRSRLAIMPQGTQAMASAGFESLQPMPMQQPQQQGQPPNAAGVGGMVQHYPTAGGGGYGGQPLQQPIQQPIQQQAQGGVSPIGVGGLVQSYPTQQPQQQMMGGGGMPNFGDGSKGVLTQMYPNPGPPAQPGF